MDLNVLRTFVAVCEYSGFSAAGERLGYTQSTVSSQIRQLEKELNVALFDRFYHRIVLTQEGSLVLRYARDVLTAQEKLMVAICTLLCPARCAHAISMTISSAFSAAIPASD